MIENALIQRAAETDLQIQPAFKKYPLKSCRITDIIPTGIINCFIYSNQSDLLYFRLSALEPLPVFPKFFIEYNSACTCCKYHNGRYSGNSSCIKGITGLHSFVAVLFSGISGSCSRLIRIFSRICSRLIRIFSRSCSRFVRIFSRICSRLIRIFSCSRLKCINRCFQGSAAALSTAS